MTAPASFETTRAWRYEGFEGGIEDSLIVVDNERIGGVYHAEGNPAQEVGWGWDDGGLPGQSWISWGPRGLSCGHSTREAAEAAQVREYATNPDYFDRVNAMEEAAREDEEAEREAEAQRRDTEREEADRRRRLGDDEPGPTSWTLPAYHALYAPLEETNEVREWFAAHDMDDVSGIHEVRVEHRATRHAVVYEAVPVGRAALSKLWGQGSGRHGDATETHVITLVAEPPEIASPSRPDLHGLWEQHWPAQFPLIDFGQTPACGCCTREAEATVPDQLVPWPCPTVTEAIGAIPESVPCPAVSAPAGPGTTTNHETNPTNPRSAHD